MEQPKEEKSIEYTEELYLRVKEWLKRTTVEDKNSFILYSVKRNPDFVLETMKLWKQGSVTSKEVNEPKTRNEPPPESPSERRDYREKRETNHKRGYRTETIKRIPNYTANDLKKPNGYMFTCNEHTMRECLEKQLFGNIPQALTDMQQFIKPNFTKLFLYNYSSRKLFGVFEAISEPAMAIDNSAWTKNDLQDCPYPAQVQVLQIKAYLPLDFTEIRQYIPRKNQSSTIDPEFVEELVKMFEEKGSAEDYDENNVEASSLPPPPPPPSS